MKKTVLAIILAVSIVCVFAACGEKPEPVTEPITTEFSTTIVPDTTFETPSTADEPTSEVPDVTSSTAATDGSNKNPTTTTAVADEGKDPTKMAKAELVQYFNDAANKVRNEKPAFIYTKTDKVINPKFQGGVVSALQPVVPPIVKSLMPGDPVTTNHTKGKDNRGTFLSANAAASSLKVSDVASISAAPSGSNYVITVKLPDAVNPANGGASAFSRLFEIKTPTELIKEITGENGAISADPANVTLKYHSANVKLTVDANGNVIGLTGGFDVNATAKDAKVIGMKTTFVCDQTSRLEAKSFKW